MEYLRAFSLVPLAGLTGMTHCQPECQCLPVPVVDDSESPNEHHRDSQHVVCAFILIVVSNT